MRCIIAAALFAALPTAVFADGDAILTISNDAGAVTTVRNLSDRECHAAALLLTESRPVAGGTLYFTTIGGSQQPSSPRTPELTKVECLHPEEKKP